VPRLKKGQQPLTTAQQLGSLIKSARDIMRKDKGLSTDIDRLPMLTWIMFLKFLDDMEQIEESKAAMRGGAYRSAIEPPYRWRDWAAKEDGITGPELIAFVSQEECTRPDGSRGLGLLPYLRSLHNGPRNRRSVIGAVFKDISNRMLSGYLLRDVINKVNGIHFLAKEEVFMLGTMYETMLREMRDAAGQNGEFYTPRPVVRFMVEVTDPRLGETVLDPACGTGGFLVETYRHLEAQCQAVEDRQTLQERSIFGGEAKPLPYLLCQMNVLLHGVDSPQIDPGNSLRDKISELGDADRVDVILTNPPFGGEEEAGIKNNFPSDMQTSETALLFLQLIMRKLRRPGHGAERGGRAAVIVPNGTLFGDGVCARIKEQLLTEFDLHTIVRLPNGVFAPYTSIPTNLLFFERGGPTKEIWYYELSLPEGRKNYTKTKPLAFEEFADCIAWWPRDKREENEHTWRVPAADVLKHGEDGDGPVSVNLDIKNPNAAEALEHLPPEQLIEEILAKEREIIAIMEEMKADLASWDEEDEGAQA
jgi:type I restriction enzyme M protein